MKIPGFHPFGPDDLATYQADYRASGTEISDMGFVSRLAWGAAFDYQAARIAGLTCLASDGGVFTCPHLVMPLGDPDRERLLKVLAVVVPTFESMGWPLQILYVDEGRLPLFGDLPGFGVRTLVHDDFTDYVYDAEALRTLSGKSLHGQKNQLNRFARHCPDATTRPLAASDRDECLDLAARWCRERGIDCLDPRQSDLVPIRRVFDHYDAIPVLGAAIQAGGRIVAFAMGAWGNGDTALVHFEKAESGLPGLYAAISHRVATEVFPDARWINREEDMGIPGLRQAKLALGPVRRIRKYEIHLERK